MAMAMTMSLSLAMPCPSRDVDPIHWKKELPFDEVLDIQNKCGEAMDLWGYKEYTSEGQMNQSSLTDSVLPLEWEYSKLLVK